MYKLMKSLWNNMVNNIDDKIIKFPKSKEKCGYCKTKKAKWKNMVVLDYACSDCVPRGCSCRLYKLVKRPSFLAQDYKYEVDSEGNEIPCEDWQEI